MSAVIDASSSSFVQADFQNNSDDENKIFREKVCSAEENAENSEIVRCFVCDATVQGRRYALATCKTLTSRTRVIEKLGELVGERYVVVISEDDVICRSCANLINTLDRLECEMKGVKSAVLRFLEQKYSLAEGELIRCSQVARLGQPPQITRSESAKTDHFSRKRSALCMDEANCSGKRTSKSSDYWMQCDKCCYTTLSSTFAAHHTRQASRKRSFCDKCGQHFAAVLSTSHCCKNLILQKTSVQLENPDNEPQAIQTAALETIDLSGSNDDPDRVMSIPSNMEPPIIAKEEQIQLVSLANQGALQFQNFLANDGSLRDGQPLFMRVLQQLGGNEDFGQTSLIPVMNDDMLVKTKENTSKQMLTLAEDGSLEIVAVDCWNDEDQTGGISEEAL